MIEVNSSIVTVDQWSTGVMLKIIDQNLHDNFSVEYEHSAITLENLSLERLGKSFGDFAVIPVPNYLLTVAGTVTVSYANGSITVTVQAATKPTNYETTCKSDVDVDRAAISDVEGRVTGLTANVNAFLNTVYPVGSIYMSVNDVSPSTLFGGEWERIEDTFLLASGSAHAAGTNGGAESQTIAAHKHLTPIGYRNNGANVAITGKNGYESNQNFSGMIVAWSASSGSGSYNDIIVPHTAEAGGTTVSIMPPYLAVYIWKRTG